MSKRRLDSSKIAGMLNVPTFGGQQELQISDPVVVSQMTLKLDAIKPYDKNPRKAPNPHYDAIKASIKEIGLTQPFNVTRRPGDDKYMISSGGNTRYSILVELYEETQEERFNQIHCFFVPWKEETDVLANHLIENLMRGDMRFIDVAIATLALKNQITAEQNKHVSDREFVRICKQRGYSNLSERQLGRMDFAVAHYDLLENAFNAGMGAVKVDQLRALSKKCKEQLTEIPEAQQKSVMANTMTECDAATFDVSHFETALIERLAEINQTTPEMINLMLNQSASPSSDNQTVEQQLDKPTHTQKPKNLLHQGYEIAQSLISISESKMSIAPLDTYPGYKIIEDVLDEDSLSGIDRVLVAVSIKKGTQLFFDIDLLNDRETSDQVFELLVRLIKNCRLIVRK